MAFGCWLLGSLLRTLPLLCTQHRCSRAFGQTSPAAFQKPSPPSAIDQLGRNVEPPPLQIEQQLAPVVCALAGTVGEPDQLLAAFRRRTDQNENALFLVFETSFQVNAVAQA